MTDLYLGLLSGTSMDAIDIAAIDFKNGKPRFIASMSQSIPSDYKNACLHLTNSGQCTISEIGELDQWAGELFADAVEKFLSKHDIDKKDIAAIGSHGQTIWHAPFNKRPFTWQIGDANVIAVKTGITTIADFRRADVAAGGQGAPFAPAFHQSVFSSPKENRCILNIGGISNISILANDSVTGFDTGPGNGLMDSWVKQNFNIDYDKDGEIAQTGSVSQALLSACLNDPYFAKPAPKSTGREYFNDQWLKSKIQNCAAKSISATDVLTTLLHLTATSISQAIKNSAPNNITTYVCGGGTKNLSLMQKLSKHLGQDVHTTDVLGIAPDWVESALFAWLAKQTLSGKTVDTTQITGASRPVILGGIYGKINS